MIGQPAVHARFQYFERQRSAAEQRVVEGANIEFRAQRRFGFLPQLQNFQLTDLVGERLTRPGDVAIDLVDDVELGLRGIHPEKIDCLLTRPALVVHAGVDDEAHRPPHFVSERAESRVRIIVEAEFIAQALAVKAPALGERGKPGIAPECRHVGQLHLQRNLQMMTRHGLVH